jgi:hypothetical protein
VWGNSHVYFGKMFPGGKGSAVGALSWCNSQYFCRQSSGRSLRIINALVVKCHSNVRNWLFGLSWRILCEQALWSQREVWAFFFLFALKDSRFFSVTVSLHFPCTGHSFFPERLSDHYLLHFFRDMNKIWFCSFVGSIAKSNQSKHRIPNETT